MNNMNIEQLKDYLPLLIPMLIIQLALLIYAVVHILRHKHYRCGNRVLWLVVVLLLSNFVGPLLYIFIGKSNDEEDVS